MKKSFSKKGLSGLLLCLVLLISTSISVSAYNHLNPLKKSPGGPFNKKYCLVTSDTTYNNFIQTGFSRWNSARRSGSAVCSYSQTTSLASSHVDCRSLQVVNQGWNGITDHFNTDYNTKEYQWAEIIINTARVPTTNPDFAAGVVCHEIGHALGLGEDNSKGDRVMCQEAGGRYVTSPQTDDMNGVYYLYN